MCFRGNVTLLETVEGLKPNQNNTLSNKLVHEIRKREHIKKMNRYIPAG
jgi:hypothetical protein